MKLQYIILLFVSVLCIAVCICLLVTYWNLPETDGEALESLRDVIKEFDTLPSGTDGAETADAVPLDTIPPDITVPAETGGDSTTAGKPADDTTTAGKTDGEITTSVKSEGETVKPAETDGETAVSNESNPAETSTAADASSGAPAVSLNFEKLWKVNPEICGWLEIADTRIDYPVLQSPDDDKKYLKVAYNGSPYVGGALFTEATYNSTDFNDPVTVIYGHTMNSGMLFGDLQKSYSSDSAFQKNSKITLYLPGEVRQYTVFAAVPYERVHILHTYDFSNDYWYNRFFSAVGRIRAIGANFDRDSFPEAGDRILILSVCLNENTDKRYLVMAVLDGDLADNDSAQQEE